MYRHDVWCNENAWMTRRRHGRHTSNFLNFAGRSCTRLGIWRSPITRTRTMTIRLWGGDQSIQRSGMRRAFELSMRILLPSDCYYYVGVEGSANAEKAGDWHTCPRWHHSLAEIRHNSRSSTQWELISLTIQAPGSYSSQMAPAYPANPLLLEEPLVRVRTQQATSDLPATIHLFKPEFPCWCTFRHHMSSSVEAIDLPKGKLRKTLMPSMWAAARNCFS